ncbi:MAG TPA: regulatory iron-sulfur-containing complex subunit RicT [Candidatus Binataceae bacterium]
MSAEIDPFESQPRPPLIAAVSLQTAGHLLNYASGGLDLKRGDRVVIETDSGPRIATVEIEPHEAAHSIDPRSLRTIVRPAEVRDLAAESEYLTREAQVRRLCLTRIRERGLAMKFVNVEFTLDGRKAVFFYVAEDRVDFRDLVRDLANTLRIRIEMKQIGARDESKFTGAVGPCGRELCCSSWLRDFEAITVKMAREQGLALNPSRLAGMCGRLKCCLRYEYATYLELKRELPALGRWVEAVTGEGRVIRQNVIKQTVLIQRESDQTTFEVSLAELVEKRPK